MKLLNWASEKVKELSDWHGRRLYGDVKRFNKLAPIAQPPNRASRAETRWRVGFMRQAFMPASHGGPILTGVKLRRVSEQCADYHLTVLGRDRKESYDPSTL